MSAPEKVTCPWSQLNGHPRGEPVTPFLIILSHLSRGWFYITHLRCGLFHLCHWLWFWFFPDPLWKPTITSSHTDTSSHQTETPSDIRTVPNQLTQGFLPNSVFLPPMLYISRAALRLCPSPRNLAFEGSPQEAIPRKVSSQKTGTEIRKCLGPPPPCPAFSLQSLKLTVKQQFSNLAAKSNKLERVIKSHFPVSI